MKKNLVFLLLFVLLLSLTSQAIALENNNIIFNENPTLTGITTVFDESTDYFKKVVSRFNDMDTHWADIEVGKLVELGAIGGYSDDTFKPDKNITRAEFSKILNKTLKLEEFKGSAFKDTNNHWAKDDIFTLVNHNIIKKEEYKVNYNPDKNINRIEIAKMLVRAMGLGEKAEQLEKVHTGFNDNQNINTKDGGFVKLAVDNGFIGGYPDNTFQPLKEATRGEATSMVVRMLGAMIKQNEQEKIKEIPRENGIINTDKLPKKTFEELNIGKEVKKAVSFQSEYIEDFYYIPNKIIEVDKNTFPIEYENTIIKSFEYIPYENSFLKGINGRYWGGGRPLDLLVFEADVKQEKNISSFNIILLDNKGKKIIDWGISSQSIIFGSYNEPVEQKVLKFYPNLPCENAQFGTPKKGETTIMFTIRPKYIKETKTILFYYQDFDSHKTDVIKLTL